MLPRDPDILLSVINTRLRDTYESLDELCSAENEERETIEKALAGTGYRYDKAQNRFILKGEDTMSDCLFCKIAAGEIPSEKVYEDGLCYAFRDIAPQAPTHFLVIPKAHIGSVAEVDSGNSSVVAHIFEVIANVTREQGIESYRVVSNIGEQAGQSVHHLHFHVLAGRDMTWPPG